MTVAIPFSAQPDQVLEAFRRIQEEARKTNRELRNLGDIDFPGLEDARQKLADLQPGFEQLFSKIMRSEAAGALRSGNNNGVYDKDIVSWLGNVSKQFPDQKDLVRHLKAVIEQAGRVSQYIPGTSPIAPHNPSSPLPNPSSPLAPPSMPLPLVSPLPGGRVFPNFPFHPMNMGGGLPNFPMWGGTLGGGGLPNFPYHPMNLGGGGGMIAPPLPHIPGEATPGGGFGMGGMLPMMRGMLPLLGIGASIGFAGKKIGDATDEAVEMSALRRSVNGTAVEFEDFRSIIRKAGDGMALATNEVLEMARAYAQASGAVGADEVASGAGAGMRLARERGLDPSIGVGMMGRATWLGLGKNEDASFRKLAEIMAGSGLGRRQSEAAEALLRFVDRSNLHQVDGGNAEGFKEKYLALVTSGHTGMRANAENILGGFDSAVRQGGLAGDAGKNLMWNVFAKHGITSPFQMEAYQEKGFTSLLPDGTMIGSALADEIKNRGGDKWAMNSRLKGFFGGSTEVTGKALEAMERFKFDPAKVNAEIKKIEAEHMKSDPGYQAAQSKAELERALTEALQGLVEPISDLKTAITDLTNGVNWIKDRWPTWGSNAGKQEGELSASAGFVNSMLGIDPSRYKGTPEFAKVQSMKNRMQGFDMQVDRFAVQYGVQYKCAPSSNPKVQNFDVTAGKEGNIAQFAQAIDQFSKAIGLGFNVRVQLDKHGNAIVPKPSNSPGR